MYSRIPEAELSATMAPFTNAKFKLAVVNQLMERGSLHFGHDPGFLRWLEGPQYDYEDDGYVLSQRAYDYFTRYPLTQEHLNKITTLEFDGGLEIYPFIYPFWDGESDVFNISSIRDLALLPNLKRFGIFSMVDDTDLTPLKPLRDLEILTLGLSGEWQNMGALKRHAELTHVAVFHADVQSAENQHMLKWFRNRGITVQIHGANSRCGFILSGCTDHHMVLAARPANSAS